MLSDTAEEEEIRGHGFVLMPVLCLRDAIWRRYTVMPFLCAECENTAEETMPRQHCKNATALRKDFQRGQRGERESKTDVAADVARAQRCRPSAAPRCGGDYIARCHAAMDTAQDMRWRRDDSVAHAGRASLPRVSAWGVAGPPCFSSRHATSQAPEMLMCHGAQRKRHLHYPCLPFVTCSALRCVKRKDNDPVTQQMRAHQKRQTHI
jgi:hypothetical protein